VNAALAETLAAYRYRNFWAAEARITKDKTPWVIDPCCRAGSPPSELLLSMYTNLADILWHGAEGDLVDPIPAAEWGAQVMLISSWANLNWQAIDFPRALRENVKLHFPVIINQRYYTTPQGFDLPAIGAVCAVGATMDEAMERVKELAEYVKGFYIEAPVDCFGSACEELEKLQALGFDL
jgi:hypothetical protein